MRVRCGFYLEAASGHCGCPFEHASPIPNTEHTYPSHSWYYPGSLRHWISLCLVRGRKFWEGQESPRPQIWICPLLPNPLKAAGI